MDCSLWSWNSLGKNTGVDSHNSFSLGDIPDPVIEPWSPILQANSLPSEPPGKSPEGPERVSNTQ